MKLPSKEAFISDVQDFKQHTRHLIFVFVKDAVMKTHLDAFCDAAFSSEVPLLSISAPFETHLLRRSLEAVILYIQTPR